MRTRDLLLLYVWGMAWMLAWMYHLRPRHSCAQPSDNRGSLSEWYTTISDGPASWSVN